MTQRLGVLGGTFDPVHSGHLDAAAAARSAFGLDEVVFVPSNVSPHRPVNPHASAFHRLALVALAINGIDGYRVSDVELLRDGSSYTADTLRVLHGTGWTPSQIFFILGTDTFAEIATWHEFPDVLDSAHFAVIARPGTTIETALARTPSLRSRARPASTRADAGGRTSIFLVEAVTRDVSSTVIRRRLAARQPIDGLVPPAAARHIAAHNLYTEDDLHGHDQDHTRR